MCLGCKKNGRACHLDEVEGSCSSSLVLGKHDGKGRDLLIRTLVVRDTDTALVLGCFWFSNWFLGDAGPKWGDAVDEFGDGNVNRGLAVRSGQMG